MIFADMLDKQQVQDVIANICKYNESRESQRRGMKGLWSKSQSMSESMSYSSETVEIEAWIITIEETKVVESDRQNGAYTTTITETIHPRWSANVTLYILNSTLGSIDNREVRVLYEQQALQTSLLYTTSTQRNNDSVLVLPVYVYEPSIETTGPFMALAEEDQVRHFQLCTVSLPIELLQRNEC